MTGSAATPPERDLRRMTLRIAVQTAALLVLVLLLVGAVVLFAVLQSQDRQRTGALEQAVTTSDPDHDRDDVAPSRGVFLAVLHDGRVRTTTTPPTGLSDTAALEQVRAGGRSDRRMIGEWPEQYDVLTVRRDDQVIQAAYPLAEQVEEQERILGALAVAGGVGVVLATLFGAWLARRTVKPLSEALALQRRFVADAGHELRTPLTLLSTRVQLLRRRVRQLAVPGDAESARELHGRILRDADGVVGDTSALTDILSELLMAADTRTPVPQQRIDVGQLVSDAVSAAQASAESRGLVLTVRSDAPSVIGSGSPTALRRAVTALVDNALSHATRQVDVRVEVEPHHVLIAVADDGPGFTAAALPRLFERFSTGRLDPARPATERHYGLGLSLVSEIAERHHGSVTAHNRPDQEHGAVIIMRLPR